MDLFFIGLSSWTAGYNDYYQYLTINLRSTKTINIVATQGHIYTNEFVDEYCIQYSHDGDAWKSYTSIEGDTEVFNHIFNSNYTLCL